MTGKMIKNAINLIILLGALLILFSCVNMVDRTIKLSMPTNTSATYGK